MARGWTRPCTGSKKPTLSADYKGAKKDEYGPWEPLGRLLLPDWHRKADEIVEQRRRKFLPASGDAQEPSDGVVQPTDITETGSRQDNRLPQADEMPTSVHHGTDDQQTAGDSQPESQSTHENAQGGEGNDNSSATRAEPAAAAAAGSDESSEEQREHLDSRDEQRSNPQIVPAFRISQSHIASDTTTSPTTGLPGPSLTDLDHFPDSCCLCHWRLTGLVPQYLTDILCEDCFALCTRMGSPMNSSNLAVVPYDGQPPPLPSWPTSPGPTSSTSASSVASRSSSPRERPLYPSTHYRCSTPRGAVRIQPEVDRHSAPACRSSTPPPAYARHADPLYRYPYERPHGQRMPPGPFDPLYHYPHGRPGRTDATLDQDVAAANQVFFANYPAGPPTSINAFYPPPGCDTDGQAFFDHLLHTGPALTNPGFAPQPPPFQRPDLHYDFPQVTLADTRRLVICEDQHCQIPMWKAPDLASPFEHSPFHVPGFRPKEPLFFVPSGAEEPERFGGPCQW
ncbi:uncharacterized protein AB675_8134 [Cyphellophora attinorum]|uniref:Uncharacterized protein n=1 Tax=Cyphellophora attinorum TaxID=1664694 RepID=A0A0N0NN67_9EURO|nr:uncharacterized protein AB675_8134 [Phialophora attinorum]KPI41271.1 hypothetical protein AB675_8134 [Phialophora attinorum]